MADENSKQDRNFRNSLIVVSSADATATIRLQADSSTKRLLVDVGDPGTGATNLGKAEDAAHASGDVGVMALGVRNDALASLVDGDGDYTPLQVNADGALYTAGINKVDSGNSTTATLTSGSTFTGTGVNVNGYEGVTVQLFADQDGATNGMRFEFSPDNTNWDVSHQHDYKANTGRLFQFTSHALYFRVVFVNGGTGQGAIRIQTLLHSQPPNATIRRLDIDETVDRSASIVKSVLMAQKAGTGDFINIASTTGGNLKTSVQEISDGLDIGAGSAGAETQRVSISTDDVNQSAIKTAVETIDNSVFADDAGFTLASSSVTMAGAIRDDSLSALAAAETDAVPLRVNSTGALHVTGGGGGTQFAVDDLAGATDTGTLVLVIRDDTLTTLTPADGDYVGLRVNSTGALHVTGGGGGTEYTEDEVSANPIVGTATMMERDDALTTVTPAEADNIGLRGTAEGALWTQDFNSDAILSDITAIKNAVEIMDDWDESNRAKVNLIAGSAGITGGAGAVAASTPRFTLASDDPAVAKLGTIDTDTGVIAGAVASGQMQVDIVADGAGLATSANQLADGHAVTTEMPTGITQTNAAMLVTGDEAHDAVDAGNPVKFGGRAQAPTAALEEVADNDRVDAAFDRQGRLATWNGYPVKSAIINDSTSGDNTIQASAGAGLRIAVLGCIIVADGTTDVRWEDGAGGTAFTGQIPLQAREGFVMPIGNSPWFVGSAATLLNLELTANINVHGIVTYIEMTD